MFIVMIMYETMIDVYEINAVIDWKKKEKKVFKKRNFYTKKRTKLLQKEADEDSITWIVVTDVVSSMNCKHNAPNADAKHSPVNKTKKHKN